MNGPNSISIRRATRRELEAFTALGCRIWRDCYREILSREQIEYMLKLRFQRETLAKAFADEENPYWFLWVDKNLVGYGSQSLLLGGGRLKIEQIYVDSQWQGKGLGRQLLGHMVAVARKANGTILFLTVNKHNRTAIQFYKRQGFAISGSCVTDIGHGFVMDDYVMERLIS
ncbi:MAG: Spermidine/spermine N(1)-acetyltransferase [Verrucomicrobia subdivision 3 bacterium]|nr:Spermidine/spermine N(1)-acetyltransferase [Limisphaerales bacterium]MCS1414042.1 Spermidine/spermine N(1)-acetyltransferase [Limisphaerales bacterium]